MHNDPTNNIVSTGSQSFVAKALVDEIASNKTKLSYERLTATVPMDSVFFKLFIDYAWKQIESDSIDGKLPDNKVCSHLKKLESLSSKSAYSINDQLKIYNLISLISDDIINARIQKESTLNAEKQAKSTDSTKKNLIERIEDYLGPGNLLLVVLYTVFLIILLIWPDIFWLPLLIIGGVTMVIKLL